MCKTIARVVREITYILFINFVFQSSSLLFFVVFVLENKVLSAQQDICAVSCVGLVPAVVVTFKQKKPRAYTPKPIACKFCLTLHAPWPSLSELSKQ